MPIILKFFGEIEREAVLSKPFLEANITAIPKLEYDLAKKIKKKTSEQTL